MTPDVLSGLTERQRAAVLHGEGPMLVLAGPGSGKTRVITHRIARLISDGVPPSRILALTFTNKAAGEMRDRLAAMKVPPGASIGTFHALCARLLREFAGLAALPPGFTIYDRSDQKSVLADVFKELKIEPGDFPPARVLRAIGVRKNRLEGRGGGDEETPQDFPEALLDEIQSAYAKRLSAAGAVDFDDLLLKTARLLRDDSGLRARLSRRYRYLLVDEYQDTNACQYRIARALSDGHDNIFVTGDPDQSIYGWRGADIENILAFEKDFPEAPVVRLEENFRSTPQVLGLADALIKSNTRRKDKRLIPRKPEGAPPRLLRFSDEKEEARGAAAWIRSMREARGIDYRRIAVFYRTNAMSRVLEEALIHAAIPYQIVKGLEFFQRREIKDMLAYLRLILNPADEVSLLRVINRPARGIGEATVQRFAGDARSKGRGLWAGLTGPDAAPGVLPAAAARVRAFTNLIEGLRGRLERPVAELLRDVYLRSGLKDAQAAEKDTDAADNVEELIESARQFDEEAGGSGGAAEYLQRTALLGDIDAYDEQSGAVALMTLHSAKGLEFEAVLIVGVEDGIIPHARSGEGGRDLEEERRLLFVGITRAERFLALSHAVTRTFYGSSRPAVLSPFLKNLPGMEIVMAPFLERPFEESRAGEAATTSGRAGLGEGPGGGGAESEGFRLGQRVRHPALGPGRIEAFVAGGAGGRAVIQFEKGARLIMGLRAARLEALD